MKRRNFYAYLGWMIVKKLLLITVTLSLYYTLKDPAFDYRLRDGVVWGLASLALMGLTGFDIVMYREDLWNKLKALRDAEKCNHENPPRTL